MTDTPDPTPGEIAVSKLMALGDIGTARQLAADLGLDDPDPCPEADLARPGRSIGAKFRWQMRQSAAPTIAAPAPATDPDPTPPAPGPIDQGPRGGAEAVELPEPSLGQKLFQYAYRNRHGGY